MGTDDLGDHVFPTCFACGPARQPGDGLRLFPGFVDDRPGEVACPLVFHESFADEEGVVPAPIVWAALDCPSGWAFRGDDVGPFVSGTITAEVRVPVLAGREYVVQGWRLGRDGRKLYSASAVFAPHGGLIAACRQTWILVR